VKKRINANLKKCFWPLLILLLCQTLSALLFSNNSAVVNNKVFFGLILSNSWAIAISLSVFVALILYQLLVKRLSVPLSLITAAVLSNVLDRLLYGGVIDYFSYSRLPVFNLADATIVLSVTYLCFLVITQKNAQS